MFGLSDLDDVLTEKASAVFKCFTKHMNSQLEQYALRQWKKVLGEEKTNEVRLSFLTLQGKMELFKHWSISGPVKCKKVLSLRAIFRGFYVTEIRFYKSWEPTWLFYCQGAKDAEEVGW